MVAMALSMFVMVILSQAFIMSLDAFSALKGIGDMQQNLRTAEVMLRDDLSQDHFTGKRRLSDLDANGNALLVAQPLQDGFFVVRRSSPAGSAMYVYEGNDGFGLPSYRAFDHMIYLTVKKKGNRQENFFNTALQGNVAAVDAFFTPNTAYNMSSTDLANSTWASPYSPGSGSGVYSSQWAEVLYYLVRTGSTEAPTDPTSTNGTPTFALYRAQWVMVPDGSKLAGTIANAQAGTFAGMSCNPTAGGTLQFYSPADAALGQRVIPDLSAFSPAVFPASTLVLPNVVSFQVQVMQLAAPGNASSFDDSSGSPSALLYDTTKAPGVGLKGIQITLRVWEGKTRQTRQVTVAQDL